MGVTFLLDGVDDQLGSVVRRDDAIDHLQEERAEVGWVKKQAARRWI